MRDRSVYKVKHLGLRLLSIVKDFLWYVIDLDHSWFLLILQTAYFDLNILFIFTISTYIINLSNNFIFIKINEINNTHLLTNGPSSMIILLKELLVKEPSLFLIVSLLNFISTLKFLRLYYLHHLLTYWLFFWFLNFIYFNVQFFMVQ